MCFSHTHADDTISQTDWHVKESMRMMAVVGTGIGRVVNEELQLGPHTIPKGTILWAPIQAIQSSPALWDQPDTFMPVRVFSFWRSLVGWSRCAC